MTRTYLGRERDGIRRELHSSNTPSTAQHPPVTTIGLATGWNNPASDTPRASAGRPESGILARALQLDHGGGRMPDLCQRGADVKTIDAPMHAARASLLRLASPGPTFVV